MAGPQNWRVRLDYALVLGSRLSTITGAFFADNLSRQKSQWHDLWVTLPSQPLLSRSLSRVCRTKIEQRVIGHWSHHDGLDYLSPAQKSQFFSRQSSESRSVNGPLDCEVSTLTVNCMGLCYKCAKLGN